MTTTNSRLNHMIAHQVVARNFSEASENKMHSDEMAAKYGFRGALVPGVAIYGHLTYPLVKTFGEAWLSHSVSHVRLLKPTYDGDPIQIEQSNTDDGQQQLSSTNQHGEVTAVLTSHQPANMPTTEDLTLFEGEFKNPQRVEINWQNVIPNQPFSPWELSLSAEENKRFTAEISDPLDIYNNGAVHPHFLLSLANTALMNEYLMPAWIHASSEIRHRELLRVGDTIVIRAVPLEKWRKKGHEFIRLYVSFWRDEVMTTDILHTAIFKVAS